MDKERMAKYFEAYNTDFNQAIDTFYTDDIDFEFPGGKFNGKEAVPMQPSNKRIPEISIMVFPLA